MITTNHEKISCQPFRKAFYTEIPEITSMIELAQRSLNGIGF
jgi:hypothetical protein